VVVAYEQGLTIRQAVRRADRERTLLGRQHMIENATARLIKRIDKQRN
jgi:DNA topoisomerase I